MRFELPWLLLAAPAVALGFAVLAWLGRRARIRAAEAWSPGLGARARAIGRWSAPGLGVVALVATAASAGPRFGRQEVDLESRALNVILAVDISRSMLAEDVAPNRLDRAVGEARRILLDASDDRLGLVVFAGRSYILAPLTLDAAAVQLYLDHLDPDIASEGGTDLSSALRQGGELLAASAQGGDRALVLFTDGEGHDSLPLAVAAASRLRAAGVTLVLVAQGGPGGVRIPLRDSVGTLVGHQRDTDGSFVETRGREDVLRAIATAAGGTLIRSDVRDQASAVREVLASLERRPARDRRVDDLIPRAWVGALIAFVLLLSHSALRRSAALAGVLLAVAVVPAVAQGPTGGPAAERAAALLRIAQRRLSSDTAWYNAGTAALEAGQFEEARSALVVASRSLDPELRYRARYNLGVAGLLEARAEPARRDSLLAGAAEHLREALLIRPDRRDAKWNLELASRHQPPPPPSGGGGGGGQPPNRSGGAPPPQAARSGALSPEEAERILASAEQSERGVRADQVRRRRGLTARAARDW
jgi:Ca-activated chloride channel family protein